MFAVQTGDKYGASPPTCEVFIHADRRTSRRRSRRERPRHVHGDVSVTSRAHDATGIGRFRRLLRHVPVSFQTPPFCAVHAPHVAPYTPHARALCAVSARYTADGRARYARKAQKMVTFYAAKIDIECRRHPAFVVTFAPSFARHARQMTWPMPLLVEWI